MAHLARGVLPRIGYGVASSSRVKLDSILPVSIYSRYASTTTTVNETEVVLEEKASESPIPKSTSTPSPSSTPTTPTSKPLPRTMTPRNTTSTHIPSFSRTSTLSTHRWVPEPSTVGSGESRDLPTHTLHIRSTRNNVILNLTDGLGPLLGTISGGSDRQFKNSQRSTYEATTQATIKMFNRVLEWNETLPNSNKPRIRIAFNGMFGQAREAVAAAISGPEGESFRKLIKRVEDRTKIKIGGTRAKKPRRL